MNTPQNLYPTRTRNAATAQIPGSTPAGAAPLPAVTPQMEADRAANMARMAGVIQNQGTSSAYQGQSSGGGNAFAGFHPSAQPPMNSYGAQQGQNAPAAPPQGAYGVQATPGQVAPSAPPSGGYGVQVSPEQGQPVAPPNGAYGAQTNQGMQYQPMPQGDQGGFNSPAIRALLQRIQQMNALKQQAQGMQGMPTLGGSHPSPFAAYLQNGPFS